jgi:peptidyl-prolyl cis-trans isomerase C
MTRGTLVTALAVAVATAACKPAPPGPQKTGPAVAQGEGLLITADEFKARLDEQSPFIRQRYAALDRKKEFLDNLVRFELLARAAEKEGLATDPDVLLTTRKIMVQKLVQKKFAEGDPSKEIPEADAQKYYDAHRDEFVKPAKVRLAGILVSAGEKGAPASARAAKLLAQLKASMKKNPQALQAMAREVSDDPVSKGAGGDLGFKSKEELAKQGGPAFADAVFALKEGAPATVDSTQGVWIIQLIGRQDEVVRTFDQMKGQIHARLAREKRTKEFDEYVKRLREEARVQVVDAELEKVPVSGGPGPGAPGGTMGAGPMGGPMGGPHGGMPPAAPVAAPPRPAAPPPAPAPAPAQK